MSGLFLLVNGRAVWQEGRSAAEGCLRDHCLRKSGRRVYFGDIHARYRSAVRTPTSDVMASALADERGDKEDARLRRMPRRPTAYAITVGMPLSAAARRSFDRTRYRAGAGRYRWLMVACRHRPAGRYERRPPVEECAIKESYSGR